MMRLAILISGSGSTAEAVVNAGITPVIVISSRLDAGGVSKMKKLGIPVTIVGNPSGLLTVLENNRVNVISQNGWLPLTPLNVIAKFKGNIINQHSGPLDPGGEDFGGKGMYGRRVTAARIAFCRLSGRNFWTESSVHHVTEDFDRGAIIRVEKLAIDKNTLPIAQATDETVRALLPLEHKNVIAVLRNFSKTGTFTKFQRKIRLVSLKEMLLLAKAKELAIELFPKG